GSMSGLIGLAFPLSPQCTPHPSGLPSLDTAEVPGGVFTLGGVNLTLYSGDIDFQDIPVSTPSFWFQSLSG
ncbi:hypothetical protein CPB84DRAFT_1639469, partial [Gymnopilus junonius]